MNNLAPCGKSRTSQACDAGTRRRARLDEGDGQHRSQRSRTTTPVNPATDQYARTRAFSKNLGYDEEARICGFYGPDDHKIGFWTSLL